MKAEGQYRPAPPPGTGTGKDAERDKGETPKPLALKVETRLEFFERVVKLDAEKRPVRSVRRVVQAASAVNVEARPMTATLRPDVAVLVAEARPEGVTVFSPGGPLTRQELELVQGPGDPLALASLSSDRPVALGEKWKVGEPAARGLTAYDSVSSNGLEAKLVALDDDKAVVHMKGEVKGAVLGGEGTFTLDGSLTYDRKLGRVERLTVERKEVRSPGPVEAGLDVKSTLTFTRQAANTPDELADTVLAKLPTEPEPARALLVLNSPDGKYSLLHDRDWHTFWDDNRLTVLKRLDKGNVVAQCNLATGPNAGKGRHQDTGQFRDDIRRGLGSRYGATLGAGEVDGDPAGGYRYKVEVQGRQGDLGIVWTYYLVASPAGDQLLATFTVAEADHESFGAQDLALMGSLRWKAAEGAEAR
jgi:hypothetical protein